MKITISRLNQTVANAADIPAVLQGAGLVYHPIENVNWPESFPYKPKVEFAAAHTGQALLLHYRVEEQSVRAVARHDQENIWEDSCVEFFCMPSDDGIYYNVECNCAGKLLLAAGKDRNSRTPAPQNVTDSIGRWASLGSEPFDTRLGSVRWELALSLPVSFFFRHDFRDFGGLQASGNVYKCGDRLPVPHFISWSPISTATPDFHRPDFFAPMLFGK